MPRRQASRLAQLREKSLTRSVCVVPIVFFGLAILPVLFRGQGSQGLHQFTIQFSLRPIGRLGSGAFPRLGKRSSLTLNISRARRSASANRAISA